jgi:hypothetical protein
MNAKSSWLFANQLPRKQSKYDQAEWQINKLAGITANKFKIIFRSH